MELQYDVAISFAGEDRDKAQILADILANEFGLAVFYDDFEQAKLWGAFLPERLLKIYRDQARACVVLISRHYKEKRWTTHEWRAAQERALNQPGMEYILQVRLDDTVLDGMFLSMGYLDGRIHSMRTVARMIYEKVGDTRTRDGLIIWADQKYREGLIDEALDAISALNDDGNVELQRIRGNCYAARSQYREAIACFEKIVAVRPSDFLAHFHLGIYNFRISDFRKSVLHYETADRLSPGHPTILSDLPAARRRLQAGG